MRSPWYTTIHGAVVFMRIIAVFNVLVIAMYCFIGAKCNVKDVGLQITVFCILPAAISLIMNPIRRRLATLFPINCGHRKCIFTGRSSRTLQEILLEIDKDVPSEEELRRLKNQALLFLDDIRDELEKTITTATFECIFCGSAVERYGIPLCHKRCTMFSALNTDLDVMFCAEADNASFSGQKGNVLVELLSDVDGYTGYAQLKPLRPRFEGDLVSSRDVRRNANDAIGRTKIKHLPELPTTWYDQCDIRSKVKFCTEGPAITISIGDVYQADIMLCLKCCEWPPLSDWPTRQRCWPSQEDVNRIVSHGCHLVAKSAPSDKEKTTWRFSFSLAEVELSKLVPNTARKCFLALKIILKDHLQPVVPEIKSYHTKTIFLNTLERAPVNLWVDENIEECFSTSMKEIHDALVSGQCLHYWFRTINLFDGIKPKNLKLLAWKIQRILENPAPFIFDDGSCCILPCCSQVDKNRHTPHIVADCSQTAMDVNKQVDSKEQEQDIELEILDSSKIRDLTQ